MRILLQSIHRTIVVFFSLVFIYMYGFDTYIEPRDFLLPVAVTMLLIVDIHRRLS